MTKTCVSCQHQIAEEAKFCPACGTAIAPAPVICAACGNEDAGDARFCSSCGAPSGATPAPLSALAPPTDRYTPTPGGGPIPEPWWQRFGILLVSAGVLLALLMVLFWFNRYEWMGMTPPVAGKSNTAGASANVGKAVTMYVIANANVRDAATAKGSKVVGKAVRGAKLSGVMQVGDDGTSNWLKIDGTGQFVSQVNLSENEPPKLARFIDKVWRASREILIRASANANATVLETVPEGGPIQLIGITDSGFAEVLIKTGGVGYFDASGIDLTADNGAPIALTLSEGNCEFGPEMDKIFAALDARTAKENENALRGPFANDEAQDEATSILEGKSHYTRIIRSFSGLSITGIAQHYESSSIYFAEPQDKVIAAFRKAGYSVNEDGEIQGRVDNFMASIGRSEGLAKAYSKTDLSCGA
jgi:Double zinc ribbon